MKPYFAFRRQPIGEVVAGTNEHRHPLEVVPFGKFGAGVWTGHPIGFVVVLGMVIMGLVGLPAWRWFFGATVVSGSLVGYFLWRYHSRQ